mgnify:CR=1 FL=1
MFKLLNLNRLLHNPHENSLVYTFIVKLNEKNISIWDGNSTKEFLKSRGLDYEIEGDLGPIYGFQWRHFGTEYESCHSDYSGKGIDQLKNIIHLIILCSVII